MLSPNFWGYPLDLVYGLVIIRSVDYNYIDRAYITGMSSLGKGIV